jgi:heterodisulfide reductase subunit C
MAARQYKSLYRKIHLGKPEDIAGHESSRWKNVLLVAFGQKKMFKNWLPAILHFFIYSAFLITQIELIEIFVDGFFGVHRFFAEPLGGLYTFVISFIEILSILAFVATVIFLARRNILRVSRFHKPEMTTWPTLDANIILFGEIALIAGIFCMNGADVVLQGIDPLHYTPTGHFAVSATFGPVVFGGIPKDWLMYIERGGWWLHILTVLAFLNYLPVSKHLHVLFAFPNVYFSRLSPRGEMRNMPDVQREVGGMLGLEAGEEPPMDEEIPEFGARDIFDLSWKTLLDAYSCTECGRCTAECPANLTGKKLSPRKVMMDIRDRIEEVSEKLKSGSGQYIKSDKKAKNIGLMASNFDDGKSLFDYITPEEIHACTTCYACVEACPVLINPLEAILELRRYEILTLAQGPADWISMFTSLENTGAVWQMGVERDAWAKTADPVQ